MKKPAVLRRRYIPYEIVDISDDELLFRDDELLVTRWTSIKPRPDFQGGISFTFLNKGYKLGRFYDKDKNFLYWYCDILDVQYDEAADTYTLNDLLVDIRVYPDGKVEVLDADELAQALEQGLISTEQAAASLKTFDELLKLIYSGNFPPKQCNEWEY
jgi:protein associated with RNAse G/E